MRLCMMAMTLALSTPAAAQDKPVVVEGVVVDAQTKVPLANVAVAARYTKPPDGGRIMTAQNAQGAVTLTGADGRFRVEETKTVPFRLYLELEGYVKQTGSRVFELKAGESAAGVALELDPESQVAGRVFDEESSQPVSGLTVVLWRESGLASGSATTDAEGHYAIRSVAPGDYRLAVSASDRPKVKPAPKTAAAASLAYPYTWFPGVTEMSGAMTLQVPSGAQLSGYDFHLRKRTVLAVRGTVELDGINGPIQLTLMESTDRGTMHWTLGPLEKPGPFEVTGLRPGAYVLGAFNETRTGAERRHVTLPITLVDKPLEDVRLKLLPGVRVTGEVCTYGHKDEKTDPLWTDKQGANIKAGLLPHLRAPFLSEVPGPVSRRGEFALEGISVEPWQVSVRDLPQGYIVRQVLYNGAEVDPGFFELNPGAVTHHLAVLVGRADNSLQGVVKRGDQPVDQAIVMGIREGLIDPRRRPDFLYAKTDASGRYSFTPVPPGTYRVLAFSGPERTFAAKQRFINGEGVKVELGLTTQAVADLELK